MINISKSSATTRQGDIFLMEEFFISTTLTPDLIKRYIDSIWKIVSKKFRRIKFLKVIAIFWILLDPIVLVYGSYVYIKYHFTLRFIDIVTTSILIVALIMLIVILINYKYIALRKTLNVLKKNTGCQIEYFFKAYCIIHRSLSTGLENEINTNKITDVIIENDMILFLTGDKKDLTCPVLIDKKQLTPEELEQVDYYLDLYLYD